MANFISFSDLTYTNQGLSNSSFPFGVALVAAYAKKNLKEKIDVEVFQYPKDFSNKLETNIPKLACFSNYLWTLDISHEFSKLIKKKSPETIIVFGGPNFPLDENEQETFLKNHPAIDFYIFGEGEKAFLDLYHKLEEFNFDLNLFKEKKVLTGNCCYLSENKIIKGPVLPRIENLDDIPSPILMGLMDKFFDGVLTPIIQGTRGCPFKCAYCQEGQHYFNRITKFSLERLKKELEYISKKVTVPNLIIADSNFGMYPFDVDFSKEISKIKKSIGWPKYIEASLGKNSDSVLESVNVLGGDILLGAPVQSTNNDVLDAIGRNNISTEKIIEVTKKGESYGANSFSEIILGLPKDSYDAHIKSMLEMIDAGINVVRSHQLLILPGSSLSTKEFVEKYDLEIKYRLQPRCFQEHTCFNEKFVSAEIDELSVSNNTLPYEDYLRCRSFDMTVEIFHNNGIFFELNNFLKILNINESELILLIHKRIFNTPLKEIYDGFLSESDQSLWDNFLELESEIKSPGTVKKYIENHLRDNEQLKYRAKAFFYKMKELHNIAFDSALELVNKKSQINPNHLKYLSELKKFCLARKSDLLDLNKKEEINFSFNFNKIKENNFLIDPFSSEIMKSTIIKFFHNDSQINLFNEYLKQYGNSINSLGIILSRSHANKFYRNFTLVSN